MKFTDILYGAIELPNWLIPFLKIPEFVRLRGVRLSNVDSYEFKDFSGPTRWEHCLGVAYLAIKYSQKKRLSELEGIYLILAALLHDVATPPFAHTVEYVLDGYDHELESTKILSPRSLNNHDVNVAVFASQTPRFVETCERLSKKINKKIDPAIVADMVSGNGELGFLINGTIDLDNIDNVTRACVYLGLDVDKKIPLKLVDWLTKFDSPPSLSTNLYKESFISEWVSYKNRMYSLFYNSSEEELGRQAFLQHLIRRVHKEGLSRNSIIWNTDESLLNKIESFDEKYTFEETSNIYNYATPLKELVQRYRLLESPQKVFEVSIDDADDFRVVKKPTFATWLEDELTTTTFEPFVIINSKRFNNQNTLFNKGGGVIQIFKLGSEELKIGQLSDTIKSFVKNNSYKVTNSNINQIIERHVVESIKIRPWLNLTNKRKDNIKANLDGMGNWSFRQSRNESLHSYPATFVHAIPAALLTCLDLKGELILDPFGGTGQTAMEAVKFGCKAITSDSNSIATLISKVKFSYLSPSDREYCLNLTESALLRLDPVESPTFNNLNKWHHPKTISELCSLKTLIENTNKPELKNFLTLCFSDILTSCTARKGKEHGFFADNTPLPKDETAPPYENAIRHFLWKVKRNVNVLERSYGYFDRAGLDIDEELHNCQVLQCDIAQNELADFSVEEKSVAGIITSPPYLCMADYTLGQRLSYEWLFPDRFPIDFKHEVGSRRSRMQKEQALERYLLDMRMFARNSVKVLRDDGFLATVIGAPLANTYRDKNLLKQLDEIFSEEGVRMFWETYRPINWHRNHGYARLKEERIAVYIKG